MYSYPSYRKFFCDVGAKTALFFWENYPSPQYLKVLTVEELAAELRQANRNSCSVRKAQQIFDLVGDGDTKRDYQRERDFIVKSILCDDKDVAVIRQGTNGIELKWYANKQDLIVPIDWITNLLFETKRRLENKK